MECMINGYWILQVNFMQWLPKIAIQSQLSVAFRSAVRHISSANSACPFWPPEYRGCPWGLSLPFCGEQSRGFVLEKSSLESQRYIFPVTSSQGQSPKNTVKLL